MTTKLRKLGVTVLLVFSLFCLALPFVYAQNWNTGSNWVIGSNWSSATPAPTVTSTPTSPPAGGINEGGNNPTPTPITITHPTSTPNLNQPSSNYDYTPLLVIGAIGILLLIVTNRKKRS